MGDNLKQTKVVIVGTGFSGLCVAIMLKQRGIEDFIILEQAASLGGTWRDNTYPGAKCDIPSALYSYSFEHNSKWQYKWSDQKQILQYQHDIAEKYDLLKHMVFNQALQQADYDEQQQNWLLTTVQGEQYQCQHFVTAVGQLHRPFTPDFEGVENFKGETFHSAQWNHDVSLKGKRVAVIGNAASAIQFVPEILPEVAQMTIFQRTPNWMMPKQDRPYTKFEQWLSKAVPPITKLYRFSIWCKGEVGVLPAIQQKPFSKWLLSTLSRGFLKKHIKDPELLKKLTPDYPVGAKRVLFSDDYYPALNNDKVYLDISGVQQITETGITRKDGVTEEFDVIIYATGFKTNPFLEAMQIKGESNILLSDHWQSGAFAYLGIATAGFPNMHMMFGPNTNLGHNSMLIMLEAQARYIADSIQQLDQKNAQSMRIKTEVEAQYNQELQQRIAKLAFTQIDKSWYISQGRVTNNWAGGTIEYPRRLKTVDWSCYTIA